MRKTFLLLLLLVSSPALAEVRYDFSGTVDNGNWRGLGAGTPMTGSIWFNPAGGVPEGFENSPSLALYDSICGLKMSVGGYTFNQAVPAWTWSVNNGAFGPGDSMVTGNDPVGAGDGIGGEAQLELRGGDNTIDGTETDYSDLDQKPWTVKRWFLEVYDGVSEAGAEAIDIAGDIAAFHLASFTSPPDKSHTDKNGTYVGTMKDGYPVGSDY